MSKTDAATLYQSKETDYHSPKDLIDWILKFENITKFDCDPCTEMFNIPAWISYTIKEDGLKQDWPEGIIWLNPPYGKDFQKWIKKASNHADKNNCTVWGLLPANRINNKYYMDYIFDSKYASIIFLFQGKLSYGLHGEFENTASFPVMLIMWSNWISHARLIDFELEFPFKGALLKSIYMEGKK